MHPRNAAEAAVKRSDRLANRRDRNDETMDSETWSCDWGHDGMNRWLIAGRTKCLDLQSMLSASQDVEEQVLGRPEDHSNIVLVQPSELTPTLPPTHWPSNMEQ